MKDEQFRELRNYILDLKVEVAELKLMLKKQNEIADHRFSLLYQWCAPEEYKQDIETDLSAPGEPLEEFLDRLKK